MLLPSLTRNPFLCGTLMSFQGVRKEEPWHLREGSFVWAWRDLFKVWSGQVGVKIVVDRGHHQTWNFLCTESLLSRAYLQRIKASLHPSLFGSFSRSKRLLLITFEPRSGGWKKSHGFSLARFGVSTSCKKLYDCDMWLPSENLDYLWKSCRTKFPDDDRFKLYKVYKKHKISSFPAQYIICTCSNSLSIFGD